MRALVAGYRYEAERRGGEAAVILCCLSGASCGPLGKLRFVRRTYSVALVHRVRRSAQRVVREESPVIPLIVRFVQDAKMG